MIPADFTVIIKSMIKKRSLLKGLVFALLLSSGGAVSAATITVTGGAVLSIVSPVSATYKSDDIIPVTLEARSVIGPVYLYLFDPLLRRVVATESFAKAVLGTSGSSALRFNLLKSKASSAILPGNYRIAACDMGSKSIEPACALSGQITVSGSSPVIASIDPLTVYSGTEVTIFGAGFDTNSYLLLDGGWSSLVSLNILGNDSARLKILPGLPAGSHTVQIASRSGFFPPSNAVTIVVKDGISPQVSSVTRSGSIITLSGSGFSRSYPSLVEIIQGGRVVSTVNPTLKNFYAISDDGKTLRFILDQSLGSGISIRVVNSELYKSNTVVLQ